MPIAEIIFSDNGIGINKAKTLDKSIQKENESHSSSVLVERLHFLEESDLWNVDYTIKDRSLSDELTGTEVILTFNQKLGKNEN